MFVAAILTLLLAPLFALSVVLLITAETWRGRHYAVTALLLLSLPWFLLRASRRQSLLACGLCAASYLGLAAAAAPGTPLPNSRLRSVFFAKEGYGRFSAAALLPEIDEIKLGTYVIPFVDALIDWRAASHVRRVAMRWYRATEEDREFRALGTVMNYAYADEDPHHLYACGPPHVSGERLPALVFLHGSGGNFKAYFYMWRHFADKAHMIVVCPSFGFGDWWQPGGMEAVERARRYAINAFGADEQRIVLAGLSNGGTGVTRAASDRPARWAGLVFLSAFIEGNVIREPEFAQAAAGRPMLVIHGMTDDRLPLRGIQRALVTLEGEGARVESWLVPEQDHFLFFDRGEDVLQRVETWTRSLEAG